MQSTSVNLQFTDNDFFSTITMVEHHVDVVEQQLFGFDHSYIVILLSKMQLKLISGKKINPPSIYVKPARPYPFFYDMNAGGKYIVLRLSPACFYKFTGRNAQEYQYKFLELEQLIPKNCLHEFHSAIKENFEIKSVIELSKSLFQAHFSEKHFHPLSSSLEQIHATKGAVSMAEIEEQCRCSTSTINRYYKKYVGMTLGLYIRLVRFSNFFNALHNPNTKLVDLAYQYEFFDQSHFIRDFKKFSGITPSAYRGPNFQLLHQALGKGS